MGPQSIAKGDPGPYICSRYIIKGPLHFAHAIETLFAENDISFSLGIRFRVRLHFTLEIV